MHENTYIPYDTYTDWNYTHTVIISKRIRISPMHVAYTHIRIDAYTQASITNMRISLHTHSKCTHNMHAKHRFKHIHTHNRYIYIILGVEYITCGFSESNCSLCLSYMQKQVVLWKQASQWPVDTYKTCMRSSTSCLNPVHIQVHVKTDIHTCIITYTQIWRLAAATWRQQWLCGWAKACLCTENIHTHIHT